MDCIQKKLAIMSFGMCCEHAVPVPKSSVPISRETLRVLKAQTEEKRRVSKVNHLVTEMYNKVVEYAKVHEETSYSWDITNVSPEERKYYLAMTRGTSISPKEAEYNFICNNLPDIIQGLQSLFPDCSIEHKMMARSPDGKLYDVSNMDAAAKAFIGSSQIQEVILIDWS